MGGNSTTTMHIHSNRRWFAVSIAVTLFSSGLFAYWTVVRTDRQMRSELLRQAQLAAQSLDIRRIQSLSGNASDTANLEYHRLQSQLAAIRPLNPLCRDVYLVGRRNDRSLFFYLDSDGAVPLGEAFADKISKGDEAGVSRRFETGSAGIEGPYSDRQGRVISACVPLFDSQAVRSGFATTFDARRLVGEAVEFFHQKGRDDFLKECNNRQGRFCKEDLYVFVYDSKINMLANPRKPELVGQNLLNAKDWSGGKYFRREIMTKALSENRGWVSYEYENPVTKRLEPKTTYFERVGDIIICAGAYKDTGATLAMLCMNVNVRDWDLALIRAQFPLMFFTLLLIGILLGGFFLSVHFSGRPRTDSLFVRYLDPALTFINVMILVFFATWFSYEREAYVRYRAFTQLGDSRTSIIAEKLRGIMVLKHENLPYFYGLHDGAIVERFRQFGEHIIKNPVIQSCKWVEIIPSAEKARFEEQMRLDGVNGFKIWEKGPGGARIPAAGRHVYYPIIQAVGCAIEKYCVGYDLGSDPRFRAAMEEAMRSGLDSSTDPMVLPYSIGSQKSIMVYYPVIRHEKAKDIYAFILVGLQMENLLKCVEQDNVAKMQFFLLSGNAKPEIVATSWDADSTPDMNIFTTRPILAFGKAFAVAVYAGPEFMKLYPMQGVWLVLVAGILLAAVLASIVRMSVRRQEALELQVEKRTIELRKSERYLSDTLHSISDGVIACDMNGNIEKLNAIAEILTGWNVGEAIGRPAGEVFRIINPDTRENIDAPVLSSIRDNLVVKYSENVALVSRNRTEFRIAGNCSPIHNESGFISGAVLVFRNVSEDYNRRKLLRESESRLNQLLTQNRTIVWEVDAEGLFTYLNYAVEHSLGYSPDELVGKKHFYDLYDEVDRERFRRIGLSILKRRKPFKDLEHFMLAKDGRTVWVSTSGIPLLNSDGSLRGYRGSKTDITERKQKEIYQAMGRQVLQILSEPDVFLISMQRIVGALKARTGVDAVGIRLKDGEDFPYFAQEGFPEDFLSTGDILNVRVENDVIGPGYNCRLVLSGKPVSSVSHGGSYWTNDLSAATLGSEDSPRTFFEEYIRQGYVSIALVPIRVKDQIGGILQLNSRRKGFFSYSAIEELEDIADHIGETLMRKKAELELKNSENKYHTLFDKLAEGFVLHDIVCDGNGTPLDFRVVEVNGAFEEMTGFKKEFITGKMMSEFLPETEMDWIDEYLLVLHDGAPRTFEKFSKLLNKYFLVTAYCAQKGQLAVLFLDMTERRQILVNLEKRLDREKVFSSILSKLMKETGFQTMISYSLTEVCKIFPLSNCSITIFGSDMDIIYNWSSDGIGMEAVMSLPKHQLCEMLSGEKPVVVPYSGNAFTNVDSFLFIPIDFGGGKHGILEFDKPASSKWDDDDIEWLNTVSELIKTIFDLNESHKEVELQQLQLMQADKMISLGILVAGVAHEINNPNNAIMLNIDIIQKLVDKAIPLLDEKAEAIGDFNISGLPYSELKAEIPTLFTGVVESSNRIKKIVAGLKDYARENSSELKEKIKITEVIDSSLLLLSHMTKRAVAQLNVSYQENLPLIIGNFQQIEQVFINLIQNACESAPGRKIKLDINVAYDPQSDRIRVNVSDNGNGIPEKNLKRLTDPFFTTKRNSGGTGLGLSISAGIVRAHGGELVFESREGEGTTVKLSFPVNLINSATEGSPSEQ